MMSNLEFGEIWAWHWSNISLSSSVYQCSEIWYCSDLLSS